MIIVQKHRLARTGGVYIAVLGTSLIVALLATTALLAQRIQNRMLTGSADIRRAQLNADSAVQLGLLTMKQNDNWRSLRDGQSYLFTNRSTGSGSSCSLQALDAPTDATEPADRPISLLGVGYHGPISSDAPRTAAQQRVELVVDPRRVPHDCLLPGSAMPPNWPTVFAYYQNPAHSTPLNFDELPAAADMPNMGRNVDIEDPLTSSEWTGSPPGIPTADVDQSNNKNHTSGGNFSLRVRGISGNPRVWNAGPAQRIDGFVKPDNSYYVEAWVSIPGLLNITKNFRIALHTKGTGGSAAQDYQDIPVLITLLGQWIPISATVTAPNWTGELEYAFVTITGANSGTTDDFYLDDFLIRDNGSGRFIRKRSLGPGYNSLYSNAPTNADGLYWIDCGNQDLVIERSRIRGTLLVLNPGPNSRIDYGPIHLSPHIPGFPTLLVNGNFTIGATNTLLNEADNGYNYNPPGAVDTPGMVHKTLGTDSDMTDVYNDSGINGLVAVSGTLTYKYTPQIRGRVVVGGNGGVPINNGAPSVTYLPDSLLNPPPPLGGFYSYRYDRRPNSVHKAVLP